MPKKQKRRKAGGFEIALVLLLILVVGGAGYKIVMEGAWRKEDPLGNLTAVEVDALQQQARKTWEQVKDKKVRWGTSFEIPLKRIQSDMNAADQAYDAGDLKTAYSRYQSACDRIAKMKATVEMSREAIHSRNGSIELRDLGKRYGVDKLQPAPWTQAEGLMEKGHVAFQSRAFAEARSKYREAGKIYLALQEHGANLDAFHVVQKKFVERFNKVDREKLKKYGGDEWRALEAHIRTSADESATPATRRKAFEKALSQLSQTVSFAASEEKRIRFTSLLETASQQAGRNQWQQAADTAVQAMQTGHPDFQDALQLLESILARSKEMAGFEVELPVATGVKLPMVWIPAGPFKMGSSSRETDEQPIHQVEITRSFWLGKYEISQQLYRNVARKLPAHQLFHPTLPVSRVTWNEANTFCDQLAKRLGRRVRLPTEAEWEYACRAGTTTAYSCGDDLAGLAAYANFCNRTCRYEPRDEDVDDGHATTTPCGTFKANPWGLHDMHGNLLEWCRDGYDAAYYSASPARDPQAPGAALHVVRGGAWQFKAFLCRSAFRYRYPPEQSNDYIGFRVVLEVSEKSASASPAP